MELKHGDPWNEMNKKLTAFFAVLIVLIFIGYMIFDTIKNDGSSGQDAIPDKESTLPDLWKVSNDIKVSYGTLETVAVSPDGLIYTGGDSFVSCYDKDLTEIWNVNTPKAVSSLCRYGDTIYAATVEQIMIISPEGKILSEWGPFEDKCIITSVTANSKYVAFADAGNKIIFILDKGGEVKKMIGQNDGQFVIPSPYFEIALTPDDTLYVANTGHRRIEKRTIDGDIISYFGEPGLGPDAFCGCCNPSHFVVTQDGFITAEKGLNRIKILNKKGEFVEFVSAHNNFVPSVPLALATTDGNTIYAANPADSKLYVYTRK
jgi:hypothetical protein